MSRSVSYTRATSYLWCTTVIEVEPHRTAVGVYTPVECSSDLMRRAAISLSFLESADPPPIFALGQEEDFLEISFFPFHHHPFSRVVAKFLQRPFSALWPLGLGPR